MHGPTGYCSKYMCTSVIIKHCLLVLVKVGYVSSFRSFPALSSSARSEDERAVERLRFAVCICGAGWGGGSLARRPYVFHARGVREGEKIRMVNVARFP